MSLTYFPLAEKRRTIFAGLATLLFVTLIAVGVLAKNGWLPSTDTVTGRKTGWFGRPLSKNASSSWNPFASTLPDPVPQLSKEYLYAGSQLLAVEDANANAAPPADLAVWRPSSGVWWVMGGAGGSQPANQSWGLANDKPVVGDYDGDGKTDFSVFRPSTGEWYVLQSSDHTWSVSAWGTSTDIRVPADYDGDGRTDRAVWRPSARVWYVVKSSDQSAIYLPYGALGDAPAQADYDGDGRADIAVWRNSNRKFYAINSSNGAEQTIAIGQAGGEPVSADYDGDGKGDHAVRNGANWIIRQSSNHQIVTSAWQQATDIAVPNDYDGDGKCDIAVWRESNGNWLIRQSGSGDSLRQVQWGIAGDIPVPSFFRR
ncbi:MAG: VCBS repeat-containing protein [Blastocatellia bacterium]|nr:VCBS repeat-containing protein [Blastocatellia bacterium]